MLNFSLLAFGCALVAAICWIKLLRTDKRELNSAISELLRERNTWGNESDFWRLASNRWTDWSSALLDERGLQMQMGRWGDDCSRQIIGNIVCGREPLDGFDDPKFLKMLVEREQGEVTEPEEIP